MAKVALCGTDPREWASQLSRGRAGEGRERRAGGRRDGEMKACVTVIKPGTEARHVPTAIVQAGSAY